MPEIEVSGGDKERKESFSQIFFAFFVITNKLAPVIFVKLQPIV